jgi:hypothetical protein
MRGKGSCATSAGPLNPSLPFFSVLPPCPLCLCGSIQRAWARRVGREASIAYVVAVAAVVAPAFRPFHSRRPANIAAKLCHWINVINTIEIGWAKAIHRG